MNTLWLLVNLFAFTQFVACRDFYLGMFRRNDFLVAQDVIYKAPSPFGYTTASYGRLFKCPITYFRVVDRLGMGRGPFTTVVRGGLKKKYISVRIKSTYRLPVSVNIYVGCENKQPSTFRSIARVTTHKPTTTHKPIKSTATNKPGDEKTEKPDKKVDETEKPDKKVDETEKKPEDSKTDTEKNLNETVTETIISGKVTDPGNDTQSSLEGNSNDTNVNQTINKNPETNESLSTTTVNSVE